MHQIIFGIHVQYIDHFSSSTPLTLFALYVTFKGALDKYNIIPQLFSENVGIFIPLEVLAWVMTVYQVLRSRSTSFGRCTGMNISGIFYFSKSTSINTQYSSLWDTLKMMLINKIPHKMKTHWQNQLKIWVLVWFKILYRIRFKKIYVILVQCPFKQ